MASHNVTAVRPPDTFSPADERWALIQRVVAGQALARAPQLRGFLLFVSERVLTGHLNEINEYEIGRMVLGRRADFNPHEDNIVRVRARHLRAKLEQHFQTEGKDEPVIVTIPRGSYVPVFEGRPAVEPPAVTLPDPAAPPPPPPSPTGVRIAAGLLLLVAVAVAVAWMLRKPAGAVTLTGAVRQNSLLSRVFRSGDTTRIVISDASLVMVQELLRRPVSLEEYLGADYPLGLARQPLESDVRQAVMRDALRPYTSYEDMDAAHRILGISQEYRASAVIRHPRHLHIRDFQNGNFVLLGGPIADPWCRLFENHLNFVLESDLRSGNAWIRNKTPQGGEQAIYSPSARAPGLEFALVGLVPNLRGTGSVLLLAGTTTEGTEAAADMVLRDELPGSVRPIVNGMRSPDDSLEILLETHVVAGVAKESKVVAWRLHRRGE
jgi:hypothetical protein